MAGSRVSGEQAASTKTKREEYASLILAGMCSNSQVHKIFGNNAEVLVDAAVKLADTLVLKLEKP